MRKVSARELARRVVARVRRDDAWAHETLSAELTRSDLDERDSAFATALAYGVVSFRGVLDSLVDDFASDPGMIPEDVRDALVVAAYDVLYMRTPVFAGVSEGVSLVKALSPRHGGFANAFLRRLAQQELPDPEEMPTDASVQQLVRTYGHPAWLVEILQDRFGPDGARSFLEADNHPAPLYFASLPFAPSDKGIDAALADIGCDVARSGPAGCVQATPAARAVRMLPLRTGSWLVADAGAQFTASVVPLETGFRVLDMCAGRGTKSVLIAARARRQGIPVSVFAADLSAAKTETARQYALQHDIAEIEFAVLDGRASGLEAESFDVVLVDAPCTGLGTLRRHPDRRWRMDPATIPSLAALAAGILREAGRLVRPGGFVVYSTCTVTQDETDGVIDGFLGSQDGGGFELDRLTPDVPVGWEEFLSHGGMRFQSTPCVDGPDGHSVVRLKRL